MNSVTRNLEFRTFSLFLSIFDSEISMIIMLGFALGGEIVYFGHQQ